MRYSLGDLNPKRDPSPEQKRNDHLGDSGIALSANGDEDGRSAISRASTANTEVSFSPSEIARCRPQNIIKIRLIFRARDHRLFENPNTAAYILWTL